MLVFNIQGRRVWAVWLIRISLWYHYLILVVSKIITFPIYFEACIYKYKVNYQCYIEKSRSVLSQENWITGLVTGSTQRSNWTGEVWQVPFDAESNEVWYLSDVSLRMMPDKWGMRKTCEQWHLKEMRIIGVELEAQVLWLMVRNWNVLKKYGQCTPTSADVIPYLISILTKGMAFAEGPVGSCWQFIIVLWACEKKLFRNLVELVWTLWWHSGKKRL